MRAAGSSFAASTQPAGAGGRAAISLPRSSCSYAVIESPDFWTDRRVGFFQKGFQLVQTARDPARDRPRGKVERLADRAVALVASEEAVEDVAAVAGHGGHRIVDGERFVEPRERLVDVARLDLGHRRLTRARPEMVDAGAARQLREPWPEGAVLAQPYEVRVDAREDILEH